METALYRGRFFCTPILKISHKIIGPRGQIELFLLYFMGLTSYAL